MKTVVRTLALPLALFAVLLWPAVASAAPGSTTFAIAGYEYAFTSTVGSFAGTGIGNAGDEAVWNATVEHDPLGPGTVYITGGTFAMTTESPSGRFDWVTGAFVDHGGTIATIDPGANCTNQRYLVTGALQDVATRTTSGGTGSFAATLTHYRVRVFGRCVIYRARVVGSVTFAY
jgi:hypothetical protein